MINDPFICQMHEKSPYDGKTCSHRLGFHSPILFLFHKRFEVFTAHLLDLLFALFLQKNQKSLHPRDRAVKRIRFASTPVLVPQVSLQRLDSWKTDSLQGPQNSLQTAARTLLLFPQHRPAKVEQILCLCETYREGETGEVLLQVGHRGEVELGTKIASSTRSAASSGGLFFDHACLLLPILSANQAVT